MTYSDDDFGSDEGEYEGGYDEEESHAETEIDAPPAAPGIMASQGAAEEQEQQTELALPNGVSESLPEQVSGATANLCNVGVKEDTAVPQKHTVPSEEEVGVLSRNRNLKTVTDTASPSTIPRPDEPATNLQADEPDTLAEQEAPSGERRPPAQLVRPGTCRSLSVPAVPAASLVDPTLLVPSNTRSASVPFVPSSQVIGLHHKDSGRFRIETRTGSNSRLKSFTRLPSVEEIFPPNDVESGTESDAESETEASEDSSELTRASLHPDKPSPSGRSSSFRDLIPKVSPVRRSLSQPFMVRLPSVVELTAEETAATENIREGHSSDDEEDKEDDGEEEHGEPSEEAASVDMLGLVGGSDASPSETRMSDADYSSDLSASARIPNPAEHSGLAIEEAASSSSDETPTDGGPVVSGTEPVLEAEEYDAEYEDDYEDQPTLSNSERDKTEDADNDGRDREHPDGATQAVSSAFGGLSHADESYDDGDDYAGDNDDYEDGNDDCNNATVDEDNRRETELLLCEAQMQLQKQHGDDTAPTVHGGHSQEIMSESTAMAETPLTSVQATHTLIETSPRCDAMAKNQPLAAEIPEAVGHESTAPEPTESVRSEHTVDQSTPVKPRPKRAVATRPNGPANVSPSSEPRAARRSCRTAEEKRRAAETTKKPQREKELERERPRDLRLKTERSAAHSTTSPPPTSPEHPSSRPTRTKSDTPVVVVQKEEEIRITEVSPPGSCSTTKLADVAMVRPAPPSPSKHAPSRSPEKVPVYSPRDCAEEYELPPRKAPVFKQNKRVKKPRSDETKHKLTPVKSPPNLHIDLPDMDKTKRDWLFLNMFRHGDDISKYETFVPNLVSPAPPQTGRGGPYRPYSAHQTYASSQSDAIAVCGGRSSRGGRKLVQQDPMLRERERNWASVKPLESAIPVYDSILDKFCTTVTSPVIQRQIYQTRQDDLSPQLAYVLEKRVEKQWKQEATDAVGVASASYKTDTTHSYIMKKDV